MTDLNTIKEFTEALRATTTTKPYDTTAEVIRIDGQTAWVHIPGGVDETPVNMSIDAKPGDTVNVRVSGGRAWITGNSSRPPTDDAVAHKANNTATEAQEAAEEAQVAAETASQLAQATRNYFWHDAEGAHVSTTEGDATTGPNVLIDVNGMKIRMGTADLAMFLADLITLGGTSAKISLCDTVDIYTVVNTTTNDTYSYIDAKEYGTGGNADLNLTAVLPTGVTGTEANIKLHTGSNLSGFIGSTIGLTAATNVTMGVPNKSLIACYENAVNIVGYGNPVNVINASDFTVNGNGLLPIYSDLVTTELNDVTATGLYQYTNAAGHTPNAAGGTLLVFNRGDTYTNQLAFPNSSSGSVTVYCRLHYASGWSSWKSL